MSYEIFKKFSMIKKCLQNLFMQKGERENWHKTNTNSRAATKEAYESNKYKFLMAES
jgi:hypothetical protein